MADIIAADDREKSLFLMQIKFLDEQLESCQLQCDELEKKNKDLPARCSALEKDNKDISEYLKLLLVEKEQEVEEVEKRLENQQQAAEEDSEALRLQHCREVKQLQEQIDELQSQSRITAATIETTSEQQKELEELQEQLKQQQADLEPLEEQLIGERGARPAGGPKSDAKAVSDWMLQELSDVNTLASENIWNIVQEERAEHGELQETFQLLLEENEDLWSKKKKLRDREQAHRLDIDRETRNLHAATKKNCTYRKEEEQLTRQCQQLQEELQSHSTACESMQAEAEALRERLASASAQCHQKAAEVAELRAELQRDGSRRRRLEGVTQEGVIALSLILADSQKAPEAQWRRLLEILETPVPHRPDSAPAQKPQTPEPGPHRVQTPSFATDPLFLMARYRPGDLGLVPRPTWNREAAACRTGAPLDPAGNRRLPAPPPANRKTDERFPSHRSFSK